MRYPSCLVRWTAGTEVNNDGQLCKMCMGTHESNMSFWLSPIPIDVTIAAFF